MVKAKDSPQALMREGEVVATNLSFREYAKILTILNLLTKKLTSKSVGERELVLAWTLLFVTRPSALICLMTHKKVN